MRRALASPAVLAIYCAVALSACDQTQRIAVEGGIERARQVKDAEARVLKASLCAMSIGAYHRLNDVAERRALDVLCGGTGGVPAGGDLKLER